MTLYENNKRNLCPLYVINTTVMCYNFSFRFLRSHEATITCWRLAKYSTIFGYYLNIYIVFIRLRVWHTYFSWNALYIIGVNQSVLGMTKQGSLKKLSEIFWICVRFIEVVLYYLQIFWIVISIQQIYP